MLQPRASSSAAVLSTRTMAPQLLVRVRATCSPGARALAVFARRVLRASAVARRGAAAYGDASRRFSEARTHGCLVKEADSEVVPLSTFT